MLVKDVWPGPGSGAGGLNGPLASVDGTIFFSGFDPKAGWELWKSDGTEAGTILVKDIVPGSGSSFPGPAVDVAGTLFVDAFHPDTGYELWKSDGTEGGTVLIKDIYPGPSGSDPDLLGGVNGALIFSAIQPGVGKELWRSDGTEAGTRLIQEIVPGPGSPVLGAGFIPNFKILKGALVLPANDFVHGDELWRTDGAMIGLVADINPGPGGSLSTLLGDVAGGVVTFMAYDGVHGREFWASDGWSTARLVDDIAAGVGNSDPLFFTAAGDFVFFHANDNRTGRELWAIRRAALLRKFNLPDSTDQENQESSPRCFRRRGGCSEEIFPEQSFAASPDLERPAWLGLDAN